MTDHGPDAYEGLRQRIEALAPGWRIGKARRPNERVMVDLERVLAVLAEAGALSEAWSAAEAAAPEGWHLAELYRHIVEPGWMAVARRDSDGMPHSEFGEGPLPAAALLDLAAKLARLSPGLGEP